MHDSVYKEPLKITEKVKKLKLNIENNSDKIAKTKRDTHIPVDVLFLCPHLN